MTTAKNEGSGAKLHRIEIWKLRDTKNQNIFCVGENREMKMKEIELFPV